MNADRRLGSVLFALAAAADAVSLHAKDKDPPTLARIDWLTQPVPERSASGLVSVDKNTPVLFTRIAPKDVFVTPSSMDTGLDSIPAGSLLARSANGPERFCDPVRRRKQSYLYCVEDTNGDDLLDTLYVIPTVSVSGSVSFRYEFLLGSLKLYSARPLRAPVPKSALVAGKAPEMLDVFLAQTGKTQFSLCIIRSAGNPLIDGLRNAKFCGRTWDIKDAAMPVIFSANGGSIELTKAADGHFVARVKSPPPGNYFP